MVKVLQLTATLQKELGTRFSVYLDILQNRFLLFKIISGALIASNFAQ